MRPVPVEACLGMKFSKEVLLFIASFRRARGDTIVASSARCHMEGAFTKILADLLRERRANANPSKTSRADKAPCSTPSSWLRHRVAGRGCHMGEKGRLSRNLANDTQAAASGK